MNICSLRPEDENNTNINYPTIFEKKLHYVKDKEEPPPPFLLPFSPRTHISSGDLERRVRLSSALSSCSEELMHSDVQCHRRPGVGVRVDEFGAHSSLIDDTSLWLNVAQSTRNITVCGLQRRTTHERTTTTQTTIGLRHRWELEGKHRVNAVGLWCWEKRLQLKTDLGPARLKIGSSPDSLHFAFFLFCGTEPDGQRAGTDNQAEHEWAELWVEAQTQTHQFDYQTPAERITITGNNKPLSESR
ncbi:unnamed protein product [Pleuronectes platessa]|uniref:Uncharacterized protein n=1 Tax=Pleuronectes platessa TaxID=8262 RepID=A0A9N7V8I1_PLEPL|nr:unnamed protein product [Pleuronectes platessa]